MICTFFGHRNVPDETESVLCSTLIDLIENHDVKVFFVGNQGGFDSMVRRTLKKLSKQYPITFYAVLAYMPRNNDQSDPVNDSETILPDGIETVPKRFAIAYRNKWMLRRSDYVVTYVTNRIASRSAQFKELAEKWKKKVIEIS